MARTVHAADVDPRFREDGELYFALACACRPGWTILTRSTREEAMDAWYGHLRDSAGSSKPRPELVVDATVVPAARPRRERRRVVRSDQVGGEAVSRRLPASGRQSAGAIGSVPSGGAGRTHQPK